jgi:preprotein translocase subunit SecF
VTRGSWLNYGVDFAGGTLIQVNFQPGVTAADVRAVIQPQYPGSEIQELGGAGGNEMLIRAPETGEATSGAADAIPGLLEQRFGGGSFEVGKVESVGAKVGGELQGRAALAILLSFAATLVYLAFRFEWRFGLAAVIATIHDILLTMAFISGFQLDVALPTVAAVLTIVGYSLNDTIIVFDRIREHMRTASKREDFDSVLNRSINETLPRTVLTVSTVLATLVALFMFGGPVIEDFALIMIVGIVLGTYSSIFVAAPALRAIELKWPAPRKKGRVVKPARATVPG